MYGQMCKHFLILDYYLVVTGISKGTLGSSGRLFALLGVESESLHTRQPLNP